MRLCDAEIKIGSVPSRLKACCLPPLSATHSTAKYKSAYPNELDVVFVRVLGSSCRSSLRLPSPYSFSKRIDDNDSSMKWSDRLQSIYTHGSLYVYI